MLLENQQFKKNHIYLSLIILCAFIARIWQLDLQSLWLDELHTMNEADPSITWAEMFMYLKSTDQHPPLHFVLVKLFFSFLGYTAVVARMPSVLAGTISVWAIYLLGKELYNRNTGYIAAILTAINCFNLYYSQEARNYIFAFLFVTLSFLFLVRLVKTFTLKNSLLYSLFTLLFLYSHYYSLMAVCSQVVLIIILFFAERKENKLLFFKRFALSGVIIAACYAPWLPFLKAMGQIKSFWISPVSDNFLSDYFFEYFGNSNLLKPLLLLLLIFFIIRIFSEQFNGYKIKENPVLFSFVVMATWVFVSYMIPYMRSLLVVPMLFPRYTIIVLPVYIIAISFGISSVNNGFIKNMILIIFIILSVLDIIIIKEYYRKPSKTQFREMVAYVCNNNPQNYPLIDEVSAWQQGYYFKLNHAQPTILNGSKDNLTNDILKPGTSLYNINGFWIIGAHNEGQISDDKRKLLDSLYTPLGNAQFVDAWAELYVSKKDTGLGVQYINYDDYKQGATTTLTDAKLLAIWSGFAETKPKAITKGRYRIMIGISGTEVHNKFSTMAIYANNKPLGQLQTTRGVTLGTYEYVAANDESIVIKIELTNDGDDPGKKQDRNAFVHFLRIQKMSN